MPGYSQFSRVSPVISQVFRQLGAAQVSGVSWLADGSGVDFTLGSTRNLRLNFSTGQMVDAPAQPAHAAASTAGGSTADPCARSVDRGRQTTTAVSPDGNRLAVYRDRNLYLTIPSDCGGTKGIALTTDGSEKTRIKYGTASWVYGEELEQTTAFWWSPDGKKLAYYRFDESRIPDYYLQIGQTGIYDSVDVEAYPKTGYPNPVVDLFVYDVATKKTTRIDVRDGKPFTNDVVGHYVYDVAWTPDSREITFNRRTAARTSLSWHSAIQTAGSVVRSCARSGLRDGSRTTISTTT
jgi:dipeptidyl-peptidase-4